MAFPYILQIAFGQPRIGLAFSHDDSGNDGRLLRIHLKNPPVTNRVLKAFRVSRLPTQGLWIGISVSSNSTGEVILDSFVPDIGFATSDKATVISLSPSLLMTNIDLVRWWRTTSSAVLLAKRAIPLAEGEYAVIIEIGLEGTFKVFPMRALFHVGKMENEMMWNQDITNRFFYARKRP